MKKSVLISIFTLLVLGTFAQQESLTPLLFNPKLYHSTNALRAQHPGHKYLTDKGIYVVNTATLTLPFSDDFSKNTLRGYKWLETNVTDTFYNVFGTCLGVEGITTAIQRVMNDTSWSYTYDTLNNKVDSFAKPAVNYTFFGPATAGCFSQTPQFINRWPEYYTYTFDTNGVKIDSALVQADDSFDVASVVYFVADEPGTLWFDNYAYINNTYPVLPPTIGVATLDGLNEYGLAYNNGNQFTYGEADQLTSKPIDLSGLSEGDSVYLSFFFEAMGLGEFPDMGDSLIVEFKDNAGFWRKVWSRSGYDAAGDAPQMFEQILVKVPSLAPPYNYFHANFQFRFRNLASLYGNLDHWHIDYVRFDKNRSAVDTLIQDIAFVYPFPSLLKNFTQLPADQFNGTSDLADTINLLVHNMDPNAVNNPPATNFTKGATELYPVQAIVATTALQTFNAGPYNYLQVNPGADYSIPNSTWPVDSLVLLSAISLTGNDTRPVNDTLLYAQSFSTIMAYDDGSAETAYGVTGTQTKKFAYEFQLNQPDTLVGFQVMYAHLNENVNDLVFNFNIWDTIRTNDFGFTDSALVSLDNRKPMYVDSINGFTTYKLDTPIIFSNKVYLGWSQTDTRSLQIGYDLNSPLGRQHMFAFKNAQWQPTTISTNGSPMMRLIFDSDYWGGSTYIKNVIQENSSLQLFPNPTTGLLHITGLTEALQIQVMNMIGETVLTANGITNQFDVSTLSNGVYLVVSTSPSGKIYRNKIIKTSNGW
jgi:hypothetical protein